MKRKHNKLTEEELKLIEEMERFMELVNSDPEVANVPVPSNLRKELWADINEYEAEKAQKEQAEREKELVRLGLIYEKKRSRRKYYVVAAVAILAMAFGMTSAGGPEKVCEMFKIKSLGREQTQINSGEDVKVEATYTEDEVYEEIEEKYGFYPVRLDYLPEGVEFLEASISDEIQEIVLVYGNDTEGNIAYIIKPNYRTGSYGIDIEDQILDEYEMQVKETKVEVKKYQVEGSRMSRWSVKFVNKNVGYLLIVSDVESEEVKKILENLYIR